MADVLVTVEGLDDRITAEQGFTTIQRYVEKAEGSGTRLSLKTPTGRVSIRPQQVLLIEEIRGENETPADAEEGAQEGPFGQ